MGQWDELWANLRRGPWQDDLNAVPQEIGARNGNIESQGWLADNSVTSDVIRADAVIASKIQAGAITTDKLAANAVTAAKIAAGTITSNEIAADTIQASNIAASAITASEIAAGAVVTDKLAANAVTAAKIAADTITANEIAASAITATELAADSVTTAKILAGNVTSAKIELTVSGKNFGANSGSVTAPGVYFDADTDTGMYFEGSSFKFARNGAEQLSIGLGASTLSGDFWPISDNSYDLGSSSLRWATVYRVGESATSDARLKKDIADVPLGLDFVRSLRPRVFRWRDTVDTQAREVASATFDAGALTRECLPHESRIQEIRHLQLAAAISDDKAEAIIEKERAAISAIQAEREYVLRQSIEKRRPGRRLHYGLIAQEVKSAMDAAGVDSMDAAFWQESPGGEQALSYSELLAPVIRAVQELAQRVDDLERRG